MGILNVPTFFLLYFFLPIISAATNCSYTCNNQTIRFPFRLTESPSSCGFPGFNLACTAPENQTILSLPKSGDFIVREIGYTSQSIQVYDPGNCLPNRLMGFNLSGSPFMADLSSTYILFSCPKRFETMNFLTISCLGNSTRSVLAFLNGTSMSPLVSRSCQKIDTLMAPPSPAFLMADVLELRWDLPQCQYCEGNGGFCGLDDQQEVVCYFDPGKGGSKEGSTNDKVFKIIALSITIPAMVCSVGVGVFLCTVDSRDSRSRAQQVAVDPQSGPTIEGLDQATIDSYAKVVLGESKRVPGPNKETCPICLSDFSPNETLRFIPECQHSFHADCIDEWLRRNGSCPLCRKSPMPSPVHETRKALQHALVKFLHTSVHVLVAQFSASPFQKPAAYSQERVSDLTAALFLTSMHKAFYMHYRNPILLRKARRLLVDKIPKNAKQK
ncbi:hypothetical protein V2J09_013941 [Rumex salicifolius]